MRSKYSRRRGWHSFVMHIQHFFVRLSVKWKRMRSKNRWAVIGGTAAVAVAVVLVFVLGVNPALSQQADTGAVGEVDGQEMAETLPEVTPTPTPVPTPTPDPTLTPGMESPEVTRLQERLMELGYLDIDETTQLYGPATTGAMEFFQRQHGLQQDGICGPEALALIYSDNAKHYTLLEGTEGADVDLLQERLQELGYLDKRTGYYGTETIAGVEEFQANNDIGVDGKTGQVTLDKIYSDDAVPSEEIARQERRRGNIYTFLESAENQIGKPYVWGAAGPNSFDCSGLVTYCLRAAGSTTGRLNAAGFSATDRWTEIKSMDDMEIGDLIFYYNNSKSRVGHTGIYIGGGMMIDASSANGKVVKRDCRTSYWESHFKNARRAW